MHSSPFSGLCAVEEGLFLVHFGLTMSLLRRELSVCVEIVMHAVATLH